MLNPENVYAIAFHAIRNEVILVHNKLARAKNSARAPCRRELCQVVDAVEDSVGKFLCSLRIVACDVGSDCFKAAERLPRPPNLEHSRVFS